MQRGGDRVQGETVEQPRARHILMKASAIRSEEETRQLAASLRERIAAGEDFAALARKYSEDIGSAREGGELGRATPGQLAPAGQQATDDTPIARPRKPCQSDYSAPIE